MPKILPAEEEHDWYNSIPQTSFFNFMGLNTEIRNELNTKLIHYEIKSAKKEIIFIMQNNTIRGFDLFQIYRFVLLQQPISKT